jgi:hypothetical protein
MLFWGTFTVSCVSAGVRQFLSDLLMMMMLFYFMTENDLNGEVEIRNGKRDGC